MWYEYIYIYVRKWILLHFCAHVQYVPILYMCMYVCLYKAYCTVRTCMNYITYIIRYISDLHDYLMPSSHYQYLTYVLMCVHTYIANLYIYCGLMYCHRVGSCWITVICWGELPYCSLFCMSVCTYVCPYLVECDALLRLGIWTLSLGMTIRFQFSLLMITFEVS